MRIGDKHVDATLPYIDLDEVEVQALTRADYEQLAAFEATLTAQPDAPDVVISSRLFGRLLQTLAVELLHGKQ